jgi:hypothetical protein
MNIIHYLATWRLPRTSGYSYPRVTAIWIDVHPVGENLIHTTSTLQTPVHVCPAYTSYGQSIYVATIHQPSTALNRPYCSWEKGLPTQPQPGSVIHGSITQFLFQHSHWSSNKSQESIDNRLHRFIGPINTSMLSVRSILACGGQPIGS